MDEQEELRARADQLAQDVLRLSRNTLLVHLRFLDMALSIPKLFPCPGGAFATDGEFFIYDPLYVLRRYKAEKESTVRDYLHMILHCVFRHMFISEEVDPALWDLSCDIAVEAVITGLGIRAARSLRETEQNALLRELEAQGVMLTAEKLCRYFREHPRSSDEINRLREVFAADDHSIWYMTESERHRRYGLPLRSRTAKEPGEDAPPSSGESSSAESSEGGGGPISLTEEQWKSIAEQMQMDMETFSRRQGEKAGSLMQNLQEVNRERYDYSAFLRKFASRGEAMKINDDEFDYIFYTYGLKLYKRMPLVEPLEYKEIRRIREFVIAIDTSGSTSGELVRRFVQKTYNILKTTESFFTKINLHIIQCDAKIQEDCKITSQKDFDRWLETLELHGLGGTDFRPVFEYVDNLRHCREFENLKGLIYFTDGWGTFPDRAPDYETAFVFLDENYNNPEVPSWAIRLMLQPDEI